MMTELAGLAQSLIRPSLVLSALILLVLLLRKPVRLWLGSIACYWLWQLPLWLPLYGAGDNLAGWLQTFGTAAGPTVASAGSDGAPPLPDLALLPFDWSAMAIAADTTANRWWPALVSLWLAGTLALLVWQAGRWWLFSRRVRQQGRPADTAALKSLLPALGSDVRAVTLPGMSSAALFGVRKPVLLLPETFTRQHDADQQHIILAHEAVHLRRHDNAWNLGATVLRALFWWNPLLWLAWRCFRFDQELSCDAHALATCNHTQQKRYARTLLESIGTVPGHGPQPALSAWDNFNELKERMQMISEHMQNKVRPAVAQAWMGMIAMVGAVMTLWLAASLSLPAVVVAAEPAAAAGNDNAAGNTPENVGSFFTQFIQLINEKKFDEARQQIPTLQQWIDNDRLSGYEASRALQMMFAVHVQGEQYEEARAVMEKAIALENGLNEAEKSQARYQLAQLWFQQEKWQEGIAAIENWLETAESPKGGPYYLLAAGYYNLEQYEQAIAPAEQALAIGGENSQESWRQMLAALYLQTEQYAKALPVVREQVRLYPEKAVYRNMLTNIEQKLQEAPAQ